MKLVDAIATLRDLQRRLKSDDLAAIGLALGHLVELEQQRRAKIDQAIHMVRNVIAGPDNSDLESTWSFLRDKLRFSEEEKQEIERGLGLR